MAEIVIYVRLLDEGTECARPTSAIRIGDGLYKLLPTPNYNPEDELWEFPPDSIVRVQKRRSGDETFLFAVAT